MPKNLSHITARRIARLTPDQRDGVRLLFLAKHACSGGAPDAEDGNHAVYHHEMLTTLRATGLDVSPANSYRALFNKPDADFIFPLLNRGGFQNSEMLAPLLLERHGLPYLGAAPILRGLSDDKHLMKLVAAQRGVPTMDWRAFRIGSVPPAIPPFRAQRYVVKPNASSASWGVSICGNWAEARHEIEALHAQHQDVIVEAWAPQIDVAVPVVGGQGPIILPAMAYAPEDGRTMRSYEEKRGLVAVPDDPLELIGDKALEAMLQQQVRALLPELWPFDYGRFEFRLDPARGLAQFMEVNLSCNLWSKKSISRSAASVGIEHASLVESIVAHSLNRQGVAGKSRQELHVVLGLPVRANALILAGQREGRLDPLASAYGVSHKCVVPVAGKPMIVHVVEALAAHSGIGTIQISIEDMALLDRIPGLRSYLRSGKVKAVRSLSNLADSVIAGVSAAGEDAPLLITTADNVLLTPTMIEEMMRQSAGSDGAAGLTKKEAVLAAHPEGQRRFYDFGGQAWSNCNLYWLGNGKAMRAADIFRGGGQFVKHPARVLNAFGLTNMVRFLLGIGTLEGGFERISKRLGLTLKVATISDGASAIDVDNERTHGIAEGLLRAREEGKRIAA